MSLEAEPETRVLVSLGDRERGMWSGDQEVVSMATSPCLTLGDEVPSTCPQKVPQGGSSCELASSMAAAGGPVKGT